MNPLWPAASRAWLWNPGITFRTCQKLDSLAARLNKQSFRQYTVSALPLKRRTPPPAGNGSYSGLLSNCNTFFKLPAAIRCFTSASQQVVRKYDELPADYEDQTGLPYRLTPLAKDEVKVIFGENVSVNTADRIMRILHGRRVAGTLDDPNLSDPSFGVLRSRESALAWLRKAVPVDEVESAGLRAEQELAAMEGNLMDRAQNLGLYKPNSGKAQTRDQSKGVFDRVREGKEKAWEEEQERLKRENEERIAQGLEPKVGTLERISQVRAKTELARKTPSPRLQRYLDAAKSTLPDEPPEMTKLERLWPSALVAIAIVSGSLLFAYLYTPPRKSARLWPEIPPSAATIAAIIFINANIMLAWRIPPMFKTLNMYFMVVPGYPRAMSMIGNVFSHQTPRHFATNMIILWFVGVRLHDEIGRGNFLAIYLAAGALGSFTSLTAWVIKNKLITSHLGASGAVCGIVGAWLTLNANDKIQIFGVFPPDDWPSLTSLMVLVLLLVPELYGISKKSKTLTSDHWAHLGGYATGIGAVGLMRFRAQRRRAMEIERRTQRGDLGAKPSGVI